MNIRTAVTKNIDELLILVTETIKSTCKNDYNQEQINAWVSSAEKKESWEKFINNHFSLIADINNKIVGFGSLENGDHIYFMYVHKNYLRQGIANKIYNKLEKESKRLGHLQITANVSKTALPFFKSKGFKVAKKNRNVRKGITLINYYMIKSL